MSCLWSMNMEPSYLPISYCCPVCGNDKLYIESYQNRQYAFCDICEQYIEFYYMHNGGYTQITFKENLPASYCHLQPIERPIPALGTTISSNTYPSTTFSN